MYDKYTLVATMIWSMEFSNFNISSYIFSIGNCYVVILSAGTNLLSYAIIVVLLVLFLTVQVKASILWAILNRLMLSFCFYAAFAKYNFALSSFPFFIASFALFIYFSLSFIARFDSLWNRFDAIFKSSTISSRVGSFFFGGGLELPIFIITIINIIITILI